MEPQKIPIEMEFLNRIQFAMVEDDSGFEPCLPAPEGGKCIGEVDVYLKKMFQVIQKAREVANELLIKCNTHSQMQDNDTAKRKAFAPYRKVIGRIHVLTHAFVVSVGDRYPKMWGQTSGILFITKGWKIYWLKMEVKEIADGDVSQVIVLSPDCFEVEA